MIPIPQFTPKRGLSSFVRSLFANSEQGAWYDPSDMATLFQDAAGTTPVTAVEQPVSLMLDKSKGLVASTKGGRLPGLDGSYFSTPDSSTNSITSDIDIRVKAMLPDWTPSQNNSLVTKWDVANNKVSYGLTIDSAGKIGFNISSNGSYISGDDKASSVATGFTDGTTNWVRATWVASTKTVTFYTSLDGSSWTQLGTTVTTSSSSIYDSTTELRIGQSSDSNFKFNLTGKVYRVQIYNGIGGSGGTLAVDFNPMLYTSGSTFTAATGEVWTINGSANITPDGNHAYTPSTATASRPVLSARVNLLTKTEQFDDAVWTKNNLTVTANSTTAPDGTNTADAVFETSTTNAYHSISTINNPTTVPASSPLTALLYIKANGRTKGTLSVISKTSPNEGAETTFDLVAKTVVTNTNPTGTVIGSTITELSNGWFCVSISGTIASKTDASIVLAPRNDAGSNTYTGDVTKGFYIWGADLRVSNDGVGIPSYQRVNTSTDYDTVGFPMYLKFDGSDDYMLTNSVDFSGTDKMTVWAGVRKLQNQTSEASVILELSTDRSSNNGAFTCATPYDFSTAPNSGYSFASKGTTSVTAFVLSGYLAPITNILTYVGNISGDSAVLRANSSQIASNTSDQGTGNYGNYPLYIGRRGGTTLPFNGRIYSMIIRGASSSDAQIAGAETYVNSKTRAY